MYCKISETAEVINQLRYSGGKIVITELYPYEDDRLITVIPMNNTSQGVHPMMKIFTMSHANDIQTGVVQFSNISTQNIIPYAEYKSLVDALIRSLSHTFPSTDIVCDDVKFMYKLYVLTLNKHRVCGLVNITNVAGEAQISDWKSLWLPELDMSFALTEDQFMSSLHRFIPEFTQSLLINEFIYDIIKTNIYGESSGANPLSIFEYTLEQMGDIVTALIGENVSTEKLLSIIENPADISSMQNFYRTMQYYGFEFNDARHLIWYHRNLAELCRQRVRGSIGLGLEPLGSTISIPKATFKVAGPLGDRDDNDIVSII